MSLQLAAQRLAAQGRGGDTTLVHMNPREVAGLQALALRGGTSLTINPQTGLPEALSLKSLLPAALGFALGPAGFGLMSSFGAAATVGGLTALTSGSLSKGLMAGMGAYGGSSLGEGLYGVGAGAAQEAAMSGLGEGASQAARNEAAAAATRDFASKGVMDRLGSGLSASVSNPSSLVSSLGGGSKALQAGYMLAAPILADQAVQTTTKMPTNDTGYIRPYTGWNPQTMSFRAEEPIRASSVRMANGGTTNRTSQEAFDYLMGKTPARTAAPVIVQGFQGPNEITGAGGKYVFDAASGTYKFVADTAASTATGTTNNSFFNRLGTGGGGDAAPAADANAPGPSGVSTTGGFGTMGTLGNLGQIGLGMVANALSPNNPNAAPAPVSDVNDATNSTASQDSASQASDTAATATTGPSGTGASAAGAAAAAASAAAAAGMSDAAIGAASQAAADAAVSGMSAADAAAAGAAAAAAATGVATADTVGAEGMGVGSIGADASGAGPGAGPGASDGSGVGAGAGTGGAAPGDSGDGGTGAASSAGGDGGASAGASAGDGSGPGSGDGDGGYAEGGLFRLARGGMQSNAFVVPADVMSALGNGSTKAGLAALNARLSKLAGGGATLIQGPGDGLSDSIPTNIDGRKPARVADGEAYIDPRVVKRLGGGSVNKGSAKLYKMMDKIRQQAHGKKTQQRPVNADRVLA